MGRCKTQKCKQFIGLSRFMQPAVACQFAVRLSQHCQELSLHSLESCHDGLDQWLSGVPDLDVAAHHEPSETPGSLCHLSATARAENGNV